MAVTNIHFASARPHVNCNNNNKLCSEQAQMKQMQINSVEAPKKAQTLSATHAHHPSLIFPCFTVGRLKQRALLYLYRLYNANILLLSNPINV